MPSQPSPTKGSSSTPSSSKESSRSGEKSPDLKSSFDSDPEDDKTPTKRKSCKCKPGDHKDSKLCDCSGFGKDGDCRCNSLGGMHGPRFAGPNHNTVMCECNGPLPIGKLCTCPASGGPHCPCSTGLKLDGPETKMCVCNGPVKGVCKCPASGGPACPCRKGVSGMCECSAAKGGGVCLCNGGPKKNQCTCEGTLDGTCECDGPACKCRVPKGCDCNTEGKCCPGKSKGSLKKDLKGKPNDVLVNMPVLIGSTVIAVGAGIRFWRWSWAYLDRSVSGV